MARGVGEAGDFRKVGFVRILHPDESQRLKLNVEMQRRLGVNVRMPGREDLREIERDWVCRVPPIKAECEYKDD